MELITLGGVKIPMEYIGDGVYAIFDGYGILLRANSHEYPTDEIYIEPEILDALNNFYKKVKEPKRGDKL